MSKSSIARLSKRQVLMIALGSAIGTGLFFGAGESIHLAGPSILLSYTIGGIIMYIILRALGEMTVHEPNVGSFSYYSYKYIGNFAGFISGWNYWFLYIIVCMLELTASTIFIDYWFPGLAHWLIALVILFIFAFINLLNVRYFGEFEFWFAGIKVTTIIALIILGIYLIFFGKNTNSSINNLWQNGGFIAHGLHGFLLSFVVVVFSFGGTELVGITAGEAENPHKNVPLAINGVIFRIVIFYISTLFIIMCLYPWNKIDSNVSPFVDVFSKIGIYKAAAVMNLVAITAALSSFNSGIYGTGRMLYNLGQQGNAFKLFTQVSKNGVPVRAIIFSVMFIMLAVILNYLYPKQIFNILLAVATIAAILNWVAILIAQIAFRQKVDPNQIKYKMPLYPFSSIIAIIFFILVIIAMSHMDSMKLAVYIAPLWLFILTIGYLMRNKLFKQG
jgi:L-asparagine transporter-like permease